MLVSLTLAFQVAHTGAVDSASGGVTDGQGIPLRATVSTISNSRVVKTTATGADGSFTIALDAEVGSILIYSDDSSTPGFDYAPALVKAESGKVLSIVLQPAASLRMKGDILFVDTWNIPTGNIYQVTDADGITLNPSGFPLSFATSGNLVQIPDLQASTLIVPAKTSFRLGLGSSVLVSNKVVTKSFSSDILAPLDQGSLTEFDVRGPTLAYNLGIVDAAVAEVKPKIVEMEGLGFYIVGEKGTLSRAEMFLSEAKLLYESGNYPGGFDSAKQSYIDAKQTLADLKNLSLDASSSVYILVGFLAVASVTAGFLLVDSRELQTTLSAVFYLAALSVLYLVYPGSAATPLQGFALIAVVSFVVISVAAALLPRLLGGGGGNEMVNLKGVLIPVFSIAKRSLKRRRLRFILTLVSLTVLVMSFVALTSLSEGYGLVSVKMVAAATPNPGVLLRSTAWTDAEPSFILFPGSEAAWLAGQSGVEAISLKVENTPQQRAITSIGGNRIFSIIGVNATAETRILPITSVLADGKLPGSSGVALSSALVEKLGLRLGDVVKLRDQTLRLEGVIDDFAISSFTDLDGSRYIPDKWVNMSPPGDPPYWERQLTPPIEAAIIDSSTAELFQALGVTRIALRVDPAGQDAFAVKLALDRGYQTWSATNSGVTFSSVSNYLEGKGLPLVIPWAIVVLNVVVTMLNSLFERRREISILSSVGLNPAEISSIFVVEASITGFIAGGLGYLAGLAFYKLMPLLGLVLEVHQKVSAVWSLAAIGIAISAVLVGAYAALRSSLVITPSLTRKWKMSEAGGGFNTPWEIPVPMRLETRDIDGFTSYLIERLNGLSQDEVKRATNVKTELRETTRVVTFIYKSPQPTTGNFYTRNTVLMEPKDGEYTVRLESTGGYDWAHETGSLVRMIAMEWSNRPRGYKGGKV